MPRALEDDHGSFAVIDLVAHLYRGGADDRRELAKIWARYSDATVEERKTKGFEMVRMHHATLTRMFRDGACDDPSDGARDARPDAKKTRGMGRDADEDGRTRAGRDRPTDRLTDDDGFEREKTRMGIT